jgi:hypothetical protein
MKRVVVLSLLALILLIAGTFKSTQTNASPAVKRNDCIPTNPPKTDSCAPYVLIGCEEGAGGQIFEVYESQNCPNLLIHRPAN